MQGNPTEMPQDAQVSLGILLMPSFSSLALASVVAPLMACNQLMGVPRYQIRYFGWRMGGVSSEEGMVCQTESLIPDTPPETQQCPQIMVVVGSAARAYKANVGMARWLHENRAHFHMLGAVATAGYLLAQQGLWFGQRLSFQRPDGITVPDLHHALARTGALLADEPFVVDLARMSCRGGTAAQDMMMFWLARKEGVAMANALARYFIAERLGGDVSVEGERASLPHQEDQRLADALALMRSNIEEPLSTDAIAAHVGLSRRQLERLFRAHLDAVPSRYYLDLRLSTARQLLLNTRLSVAEIASTCGFSSAAHFSSAFRAHYSVAPSIIRVRG
ncbi:MAG: helix-turn-helix domain-containing protein [Hahellaceae bacterium]|nr:helix-turn-helix domain-containing protein [Hahellaceae bacterium]MCP5168789.1 helix-turn-helix domain-containing protein [Hahellaceae bacterium]